ncbi:hypothetical protein [Streptomyces poonensis]|uniref:Secreted protein n=1 Tax=Streptomyces poonensis TaxID=68255 RepID=A0A918PV32_9ACTN|nr:hypothetical protein [Streptomyces poonensis]GGZ24308.1 hypothetical protein GCM10010365_50710 [Streptomyces poonensis]GLJ89957.1 hypothetical protein GCM10017589_25580 [Streptomyces poonensis]
MASIRTARALAAVAVVPLAVALCSGAATADHGVPPKSGTNAGVASAVGGAGKDNSGNSSTVQQQAVGSGAVNQNDTTQINKSTFTVIDQSKGNVAVDFTPCGKPADGGHHHP